MGISGCPQCLCPDGALSDYDVASPARSFAETLQVIRTCRSLLQERGNVTAVNALLRRHRLSLLHTKIWNPFLMVPHADFDCFPQDHLHGMYVPFWVNPRPLSRMRKLHFHICTLFITLLRDTDVILCSDLGVILLVVLAIACWIKASFPIQAMAQRRLQLLSLRVQKLTALLPNCIRVYGLFLDKGPSLQGAHYRYRSSACVCELKRLLRVPART